MTIKVVKKGALRRIDGEFRDIDGALTDPATVVLKVTKPSGATTIYTYALSTVIKDSIGKFHVDVSFDQAGLWLYEWTSTGAAQAAEHGEIMCEGRA